MDMLEIPISKEVEVRFDCFEPCQRDEWVTAPPIIRCVFERLKGLKRMRHLLLSLTNITSSITKPQITSAVNNEKDNVHLKISPQYKSQQI